MSHHVDVKISATDVTPIPGKIPQQRKPLVVLPYREDQYITCGFPKDLETCIKDRR